MIKNETVYINGDGKTTRDFCYIDNAVQANLLAATTLHDKALNEVYNIAVGEQTSLHLVFNSLKKNLNREGIIYMKDPVFTDFRKGDVRHSLADISKARKLLGYEPSKKFCEGLQEITCWYLEKCKRI